MNIDMFSKIALINMLDYFQRIVWTRMHTDTFTYEMIICMYTGDNNMCCVQKLFLECKNCFEPNMKLGKHLLVFT